MSEAFDPFREWLGRQEGAPKDYYELLGIACDETNAELIARQADVLTAQIRRIRPGPHVLAWQQMLDAVAAAKRCLTDPRARAAYDGRLGQGSLPACVAGTLPLPAPDLAPAQTEWPPAPRITPESEMPASSGDAGQTHGHDPLFPQAIGYRPVTTPPTPAIWWLLRGLVGLVLLLASVFGVLVWQQYRQGRWDGWALLTTSRGQTRGQAGETYPANPAGGSRTGRELKEVGGNSAGQAKAASQYAASSSGSPELKDLPGVGHAVALADSEGPGRPKAGNGDSETKSSSVRAENHATRKEPSDGAADPEKLRGLGTALSQAREAMARRDLVSARKHLQTASQLVQRPEDEAQVARAETLLAHLEEFWKGMQQVLANLQPAQEFALGTTPVIVVSADARSLTYRSEGTNRTVTLQDMPGPLVVALAEAGFAQAPSQKVLIAAFLAADAQGDPRRARRMLEEAARAGEDVQALLAEVEAAGKRGTSNALVPPDAERLQAARQRVRDRFQAEFRSATRVSAKTALAQKLMEAADDATLAPELRYAMLAEACDLAAAAGKAETACQAVDRLEIGFRVDAVALKVAALERMAKSLPGIHSQKEFIEVALKTASQAMEAQRAEEARKLADLALAVARRSRSPALLRAAQMGRQQLGLGSGNP